MEPLNLGAPFLPVASKSIVWRNILSTVIIGIVALVDAAVILVCIVRFPGEGEPWIPHVVVMSIAILVMGIGIYVAIKARWYTTIIVDEKGLQFYNHYKREMIKTVRWTSFGHNPERGNGYDVNLYIVGKRERVFQWWYLKDGQAIWQKENFEVIHPLYSHLANREDVIIAFLNAIKYYRPDLTIDPQLFNWFYVDQMLYAEQLRLEFRRFVIAIILIAILLLLSIYRANLFSWLGIKA